MSDRDVEKLAKWLCKANIFGYRWSAEREEACEEYRSMARKLLVRPPAVLKRALKKEKVKRG